jgi:hypothetical protein
VVCRTQQQDLPGADALLATCLYVVSPKRWIQQNGEPPNYRQPPNAIVIQSLVSYSSE